MPGLRLSPVERIIGDGIDAALLKILTRADAKPNEAFNIGVALAVRLGLERIHAVDDHTADSVLAMGGAGLDPFLEQHWKSGTSPIIRHSRMLETRLKTPADLLAYYRDLNSPATQRDFVAVDYKRAMSTPSAGNYGRTYLAWWETRNLRMVANIRAAFGNRAGARVLNIVGASHKPYYEAYLAMMSDVKLVDAATVLR